MIETKFTPGPWYSDGIFVCDANDNDVCACEQENWEADAYLIAAAPDLYEALEYTAQLLEALGGTTHTAQAALAKARGNHIEDALGMVKI